MRRELRLAILFGFAQLFLSLILWGNLEYSLAAGDMVQGSELSPWVFIFSSRLLPYALISFGNAVLFLIFETKSNVFRPGIGMTIGLAAATVFVAVPLVFYTPLRILGPFVGTVAFILVSGAWRGVALSRGRA